jgi:hypothetical protein
MKPGDVIWSGDEHGRVVKRRGRAVWARLGRKREALRYELTPDGRRARRKRQPSDSFPVAEILTVGEHERCLARRRLWREIDILGVSRFERMNRDVWDDPTKLDEITALLAAVRRSLTIPEPP